MLFIVGKWIPAKTLKLAAEYIDDIDKVSIFLRDGTFASTSLSFLIAFPLDTLLAPSYLTD